MMSSGKLYNYFYVKFSFCRGRSGVRAQALDEHGTLVDDFVFDDGTGALAPKLLHVRNAPSPGATSSLAIAKMVVDKAVDKFQI